MIKCLWDQQDDAIIDVKIGNTDAYSYKYDPMAALLDWWETIKKEKHSKYCYNQQKHFSPFFLSVKCMIGREALVVLAQLSQTMAEKMYKPISYVRVWINGRITIEVARS